MDLAALPARDRILVTAHDLFYRHGIRATGIDRVIAEAGVAKLTFYRHFPSKDELVRAFLEYRHARWMAWFVDALGRHGAKPEQGLAPVTAALAEWFGEPHFRGCAFINAVAEVGGSLADANAIALRHKQDMEAVIAELLPPGPHREARAQACALAVDGAIVRAQMQDGKAALEGLAQLLYPLGKP
ncbi:MAG: TetR/AcrR family transcriptional regulator [Comamonadaceae bacterium]|nr:MAG: TetR/AcrR family transcriptional regulator [Comamonadaceae bacterium]